MHLTHLLDLKNTYHVVSNAECKQLLFVYKKTPKGPFLSISPLCQPQMSLDKHFRHSMND